MMKNILLLLIFFLNILIVIEAQENQPYVIFNGNKSYCGISVNNHIIDELVVVVNNFDFEWKCDVVKYKVRNVTAIKNYGICRVIGSKYDKCVYGMLKESSDEDYIEFYDVEVMCEGYEEPRRTHGILGGMACVLLNRISTKGPKMYRMDENDTEFPTE